MNIPTSAQRVYRACFLWRLPSSRGLAAPILFMALAFPILVSSLSAQIPICAIKKGAGSAQDEAKQMVQETKAEASGQAKQTARDAKAEASNAAKEAVRDVKSNLPSSSQLSSDVAKAAGGLGHAPPVVSSASTVVGNPAGGGAGAAPAQGTALEKIMADKAKDIEFDPASETFVNTKTGAIWNASDSRLVDATLDRYLNQNPSDREKQKKYLDAMDRILQQLLPANPYKKPDQGPSPKKARDQDKYAEAYDMLRELSRKFSDFDARSATTLANQVDALNAALTERKKLYAEAEEIEKDIARVKWNMNVAMRRRVADITGYSGREDKKALESAQASTESAEYVRKLTQLQALQAAKVAQADAKLLLARTEFQTLILQHFAARRFQLVLIDGAFYRMGFGDGDMSISGETQLPELLAPGMDAPLTVTGLEVAAVEAIDSVRRGISALNNMIEGARFVSAERRLQETLAVGEHLPEMLTFSEENRRKIQNYRQLRRETTKAIESKDYGRAKERNAALAGMAKDYDPALIEAAIAAAATASNLHLAKANNAATSGDKDTAEQELKQAAQIWPQNPALEQGAPSMLEQFNKVAIALKNLDECLERHDLRGIGENREIFSAAVANDPARQTRLREALDELLEIERALEQAAEYDKRGSTAEAWHITEPLQNRYPSDSKVNANAADYARRASSYVQKISKAREAEGRKEIAKALAFYLDAGTLNPNSERIQEKTSALAELQLSSLK